MRVFLEIQNRLLRFSLFLLPLFLLLSLVGCSATTPIKNLTLPSVTTIEGQLVSQNEKGFLLKDASASIQVKANLSLGQKNQLLPGEKLKVYGNLISGKDKVFDAYVIDKANGKRFILQNPSPHFGLVIQSSFK